MAENPEISFQTDPLAVIRRIEGFIAWAQADGPPRNEWCLPRVEARALVERLQRAEQERDEANRWRDSWHDEARAAIKTAQQYESERDQAVERLQRAEEA